MTQLAMAVFHHYDCAGLDEPAERIAERLWNFCLAALNGGAPAPPGAPSARAPGARDRGSGTRRTAACTCPTLSRRCLSPAWLSQALGQRFPGVKVTTVTRGPVVSRGLHQRALPPRVRGRSAGRTASRSLREGIFHRLVGDGSLEPHGRRARGLVLSRPRVRRGRADASLRLRGRRSGDASRCRHHRGRRRGRRDVPRCAERLHTRSGCGQPGAVRRPPRPDVGVRTTSTGHGSRHASSRP